MSVRLVFDTHVWLDWLVFYDPCVDPFRTAVAAGEALVFMDARCEDELARVLGYPRRKTTLDAAAQAACLAECRRVALYPDTAESPASAQRLPKCRDPDDQKFLELALACAADALVTRDQALLKLARRKSRPPPFRILTPEHALAVLAAAVPS
jgi:putative PIN family toxin of toxin-antitoxin system